MSRATTAGSGRDPGCSTQAAPDSSGPNSSSTNASHDAGEHCSHTCSGPKSRKDCDSRLATIERCELRIPLGRPVEPEVNMTQAASAGAPGTSTGAADN